MSDRHYLYKSIKVIKTVSNYESHIESLFDKLDIFLSTYNYFSNLKSNFYIQKAHKTNCTSNVTQF